MSMFVELLVTSQALQKVSSNKIYLIDILCQVTFGTSPMNFVYLTHE